MIQFRYNNANDIPNEMFKKKKILYGKTVKVIDGDTIRVRHLPFYPFKQTSRYTGLLSENTISIRIYGVDAPEIGKFGKPSMPKANDAKKFAQRLVQDKVVRIKLLRKDQYGRAVAKVQSNGILPFKPKKDLTMEIAKNGYASLYTGGGAEYDGKKDRLERVINRAKKEKRGIWSNGYNIETPAQYKKKIRAGKPTNRAVQNRK